MTEKIDLNQLWSDEICRLTKKVKELEKRVELAEATMGNALAYAKMYQVKAKELGQVFADGSNRLAEAYDTIKELEERIEKLLLKVNPVTAPHRHGNPIPKRALDNLSNIQIEIEKLIKKEKS